MPLDPVACAEAVWAGDSSFASSCAGLPGALRCAERGLAHTSSDGIDQGSGKEKSHQPEFNLRALRRSKIERRPHLLRAIRWTVCRRQSPEQANTKKSVTQCKCGHASCDFLENWRLQAGAYVRDTNETMAEVYQHLMAPNTQWRRAGHSRRSTRMRQDALETGRSQSAVT